MLPQLLNDIRDRRVLVVGDAMLDRYWYGGVERISPEAPVPVIAVTKVDERPGGAANVARNVRALGARCSLLSIAGDDADAATLERLLREDRIECSLFRDKLVNTTVKLRVISRNQQLIRIDFESPASKDARVKLLDGYLACLGEHDVVWGVRCDDFLHGFLGGREIRLRIQGIPIVNGVTIEYGRGQTAIVRPHRVLADQERGGARSMAVLLIIVL